MEPIVRFTMSKNIVVLENLWRLAKLYIFVMFRTWRIQKSMFAFAQTPAWPPYWTFKMAAIKYIISAILASRQHRKLIKCANPMFSGSRNPIET